jgi:hypothetical protein
VNFSTVPDSFSRVRGCDHPGATVESLRLGAAAGLSGYERGGAEYLGQDRVFLPELPKADATAWLRY